MARDGCKQQSIVSYIRWDDIMLWSTWGLLDTLPGWWFEPAHARISKILPIWAMRPLNRQVELNTDYHWSCRNTEHFVLVLGYGTGMTGLTDVPSDLLLLEGRCWWQEYHLCGCCVHMWTVYPRHGGLQCASRCLLPYGGCNCKLTVGSNAGQREERGVLGNTRRRITAQSDCQQCKEELQIWMNVSASVPGLSTVLLYNTTLCLQLCAPWNHLSQPPDWLWKEVPPLGAVVARRNVNGSDVTMAWLRWECEAGLRTLFSPW